MLRQPILGRTIFSTIQRRAMGSKDSKRSSSHCARNFPTYTAKSSTCTPTGTTSSCMCTPCANLAPGDWPSWTSFGSSTARLSNTGMCGRTFRKPPPTSTECSRDPWERAGASRLRPLVLLRNDWPGLASKMSMVDMQSQPQKAFPVSWDQFHRDARALAWRLTDAGPFEAIVCITRGGLVPAAIVARELNLRIIETICVKSYGNPTEQGELKVLKGVAQSILAGRDGE